MSKIIHKPHLFFFSLIPIFLIIGWLEKEVLINLNDAYFIIGADDFSYISCVFFGLIGVNYLALNWMHKKPKKWLTIAHLAFQIIAILLFFLFIYESKRELEPLEKSLNPNFVLFVGFLIFAFASFIHFINFITSLLSKRE
ncbi:MAG: hypothetical protein JXQ93_09235 [Flavobacteriaceae bacterium]